MVYRATRICSSYKQLHEEFSFIEFISELNGYPENFVKSQIRKTLDRYINKCNGMTTHNLNDININNQNNSPNKKRIILDLPYVGKPTSILKKQISKIARNLDPHVTVHSIERPPITLSSYFPIKDQIPDLLKSKVVYKLNCMDCNATYIGKTCRHVRKRLTEHGADFNTDNLTDTSSCNTNVTHTTVRRSDRNKNKIVQYFPKSPTDITNTQPIKETNSAVKRHEIIDNHKIDWSNFDIIAKDNKNYQLLVKESLLINTYKPSLNKTTTSIPLIIYPEGLHTFKPKVKIKSTIDQSPLAVV